MNAALTGRNRSWASMAKWVGAIAVVAGASVSSYWLGRSHVSAFEYEGALRRALSLVAFQDTDSQVSVDIQMPLTELQSRDLQGPCSLKLVDAFPYDSRSYFSFFLRPALVWRVTCGTTTHVEAEVRHQARAWTVILQPLRSK